MPVLHELQGGDAEVAPALRGSTQYRGQRGDTLRLPPHLNGGPNNDTRNEATKFLIVLVKDVRGYAWLEPASTCTAAVTAKTLLRYFAAMRVPKISVSDTA